MIIHPTSPDITRHHQTIKSGTSGTTAPLAICDPGDLDRLATNTQALSAATGGMHDNCRFICLHVWMQLKSFEVPHVFLDKEPKTLKRNELHDFTAVNMAINYSTCWCTLNASVCCPYSSVWDDLNSSAEAVLNRKSCTGQRHWHHSSAGYRPAQTSARHG